MNNKVVDAFCVFFMIVLIIVAGSFIWKDVVGKTTCEQKGGVYAGNDVCVKPEAIIPLKEPK